MGLTSESTGKALKSTQKLKKQEDEYLIAFAGNPNVGKSTLFNYLTGLKQHTGNWAGKTVTNAMGRCKYKDKKYLLADLPGTYSLMVNSEEEETARDFLCFEKPDGVVVVCDATCLERNLNLVLQILEITPKVVLCLNLMDEAEKKNISIDIIRLSEILKIKVVPVVARSGRGVDRLLREIGEMIDNPPEKTVKVEYGEIIEQEIAKISIESDYYINDKLSLRWMALRLMEGDEKLCNKICVHTDCDIMGEIFGTLNKTQERLAVEGLGGQKFRDRVVSCIINKAEDIAGEVIKKDICLSERDRKIDRVLTSRVWGIPIMLLILGIIFWLTAVGANYPSQWLSKGLFYLGDKLSEFLEYVHCHEKVIDMAVNGVYRTLAWVVSVMLPPMAIFFPLFTTLEDLGYLPRAAFNLDRIFKKAGVCGKQALTMAMGLGCNAAGVTGCRIIESPRERLIAVITNSFMPCNGRFPTLLTLISVFFTSTLTGAMRFGVSALILLGVILLAVGVTLLVSYVLSKMVFDGVPSSFVLEMPPYRKPQIFKILVRSIFDRTIFVLGRACAVTAPAGLIIWLMANLKAGNSSALAYVSDFLDPVGKIIGMDGVILLGFILGFPANEIVIPVMLMCYTASGGLVEMEDMNSLREILTANGWNGVTALCVMIFSVFHFPCSTTCLTIKKETGSVKYMLAAMVIPAALGAILCFIVSYVSSIMGF